MAIEWKTMAKSKVKTLAKVGTITIMIGVQYSRNHNKEWSWIAWDIASGEYKVLEQSRRYNQIFETDTEARTAAETWLATYTPSGS